MLSPQQIHAERFYRGNFWKEIRVTRGRFPFGASDAICRRLKDRARECYQIFLTPAIQSDIHHPTRAVAHLPESMCTTRLLICGSDVRRQSKLALGRDAHRRNSFFEMSSNRTLQEPTANCRQAFLIPEVVLAIRARDCRIIHPGGCVLPSRPYSAHAYKSSSSVNLHVPIIPGLS